jgi:23S rRNA (adenine2503-C2)-methyltransferase
MDLPEISDALRDALGPDQPGYRARQIYEAIYRGQTPDLVQITTLPTRIREDLASRHTMGCPRWTACTSHRRHGATFCGWRMASPWNPHAESERDTICISSQVGCPVDCKLGAALMGLGGT